MKRKSFEMIVFTWTFIILHSSGVFGQLSSRDSIILKKHNAVKLTDSLNSTVPTNIRLITIEFLRKKGLNPDEFYTMGKFKPITTLVTGYGKSGRLHILRIGAFRGVEDFDNFKHKEDSVNKVRAAGGLNQFVTVRMGGYGGLNDDLQIVYDLEYKTVLRMFPTE
jgi:hypothetical protein